jgi:hypothetical protein
MKKLACVLFVFAGTLSAQQPASTAPPPLGQVTGHVSCADTGQPGRFATIQLIGEHPESGPTIDTTPAKTADFEKTIMNAMTAAMKGNNLSTVSGLDGSYTLDKVPPGTYWVLVQLAGYQSPLSQFSMMERVKADSTTLKAVQAAAEKIVVQSGAVVRADIRLDRGASIGGVIHYDDGSPAPGVTPVAMILGQDGKWKELGTAAPLQASSDDRGHYRIYGLAPGKYAVKATLPTMQAMTGLGSNVSMHMSLSDALVVYSGGAMRGKDLKPVEIGPGDDVEGIDVVFPLDNLHSIAGSVVAKSDGHPVDAGTVLLQDPETKVNLRSANIEQDGTFHLNYVPEGQYLLKVAGAADTDTAGGSDPGSDLMRMMRAKTLKSYGEAELPLTLKNDAAGLVLQVPDQAAAPAIVPTPPPPPPPVPASPPAPAPN